MADTDTVKLNRGTIMFWSKVVGAVLTAAGVTFGTAKLAVQSEAPKAEIVTEAASNMKSIKDELGEIKIILKNNDVDRDAMNRRVANLEAENRELRANDKEHDKRLAKLEAKDK